MVFGAVFAVVYAVMIGTRGCCGTGVWCAVAVLRCAALCGEMQGVVLVWRGMLYCRDALCKWSVA